MSDYRPGRIIFLSALRALCEIAMVLAAAIVLAHLIGECSRG